MEYFTFRQHELYAEDVSVAALARDYGTPLYIYSRAALTARYRAFEEALSARPHQICFAVKANSNLAVLHLMASLGAGFDIVSEGELRRVLAAGGDPGKCVYSGVGKTREEIRFALEQGIGCLNLESEAESLAVAEAARELNVIAPVALRVNPNVDARTLPAISTGLKSNKFGIPHDEAVRIYRALAACPHLAVRGIDCHIGSQMTSTAPITEAVGRLSEIIRQLDALGIGLEHIDVGGGLGVVYDRETPPSPAEYFGAVYGRLGDLNLRVYAEPGRAMVANAGMLVTRVQYQKTNGGKRFVIVDGAMNDLIRPALYGSWMKIINARERPGAPEIRCDVVGPVCESDDFLGKDRLLQVADGDLLAVCGAGAYGSSMASSYNSRRLPCELMVDGGRAQVIRARQSFEDIWKDERIFED